MSSAADLVHQHLDEALSGWVDARWLGERIEELERTGALEHADGVRALAPWANHAPAASALARCQAAVVVAGIAPVLADTSTCPVSSRASLRALIRRALRARPDLAQTLAGPARAVADAELAGSTAPATAEWKSPWAARPTKRPARVPPPAMPAWRERFDSADEARIPSVPASADDMAHEATFLRNGYAGRRFLFPLMQIGDERALALWQQVTPDSVWIHGDELELLAPRFGIPGLETTLALVAANAGSVGGLATLDSPRAATLMAQAFAGRPALARVARAWFSRFPETATVGLVPELLSSVRATSLRGLAAAQHVRRTAPDAFGRGLERYAEPVRAAVLDLLEHGAGLPSRKPQLPDFADPALLPAPMTAAGEALDTEAHADLLRLLKATPPDGGAWLDDLCAAFTPASMARLARALFDAWTLAGSAPKERWALHALAFFPDDAAATELAELAAELAPKGLSSRAQEMVEVLAQMSTRKSLELVHRLSRRVRSKAFRARAELAFREAAERMGLSDDELSERLVPDFGLAHDGTLPVVPAVRVVVEGAAVRFVDAAGKKVKGWRPPDDEDLAAQLADLKKRAATIVREAAERLERGMAAGRRMSREHFGEVFLMNPLLSQMSRGLVWGIFDTTGALEATFTLAARAAPLGVDGSPASLPADKLFGLVHPLELGKQLVGSWKQRLETAPPFEQLGRRAVRVDAEGLRRMSEGLRGRTLDTGVVLALEKAGWERGPVLDGGCWSEVSRSVAGHGAIRLAFEPGVYAGQPMMHEAQNVFAVDVRLDASAPPVAMSEAERDLHSLISRSR